MTRDKALAELTRLIGTHFQHWVFPTAMDGDERGAARHALAVLDSQQAELRTRMRARRAETAPAALEKDSEYLALQQACTSLDAEKKTIRCRPFYRLEVARLDVMGNPIVCAHGDTWEEILEQCRAGKARQWKAKPLVTLSP